jgi:hypothetical protein
MGYRCYFLDSENHIREAAELIGVSEGEAIATARRLLAQRDYHSGFEVWQGTRLLTVGRRRDLDHG